MFKFQKGQRVCLKDGTKGTITEQITFDDNQPAYAVDFGDGADEDTFCMESTLEAA